MNIDVNFDPNVFTLETVKTACYKFLDRLTPSFELREGTIVCHLEFGSTYSEGSISAVVDDLKKEVLDQDLRSKVKIETEGVRNLILAHAFSKTGLIADD